MTVIIRTGKTTEEWGAVLKTPNSKYTPDAIHEWREISRGMVTMGLAPRRGFRCQECGAFVEDVIVAAMNRIEFFQGCGFACDENADALYHLREALRYLDNRTSRRVAAKTEGTHEGS